MSDSAEFDVGALKRQQRSFARTGRLHWVHWLIVVLSFVITLSAWYTSSSLVEERAGQRFEREVDRVVGLMDEPLHKYADALLAGVAAIQAHGGEMSRREWRHYSESLDLVGRYPVSLVLVSFII